MRDPQPTTEGSPAVYAAGGTDRFGEGRSLGISAIAYKVVAQDAGGLLILENTFHAKGGPARHLHYEQDEWFYAAEGEFLLEVGAERSGCARATRCWPRAGCPTSGPSSGRGAGGCSSLSPACCAT